MLSRAPETPLGEATLFDVAFLELLKDAAGIPNDTMTSIEGQSAYNVLEVLGLVKDHGLAGPVVHAELAQLVLDEGRRRCKDPGFGPDDVFQVVIRD